MSWTKQLQIDEPVRLKDGSNRIVYVAERSRDGKEVYLVADPQVRVWGNRGWWVPVDEVERVAE